MGMRIKIKQLLLPATSLVLFALIANCRIYHEGREVGDDVRLMSWALCANASANAVNGTTTQAEANQLCSLAAFYQSTK